MTYVTKKCPHCGRTYQYAQSGEQRKYGSPFIRCPRCQNVFVDKDISEPALHGFWIEEDTGGMWKGVVASFMILPVALLSIGSGIYLLLFSGDEIDIGSVGALLVGVALLMPYLILIHDKIYKRTHREKIIREKQIIYDASMKRLEDTDYLRALAQVDSLAKDLLYERENGKKERYAMRPEI